ncbi:hypothetical protein TcasGA2_TC002129 [Tribolium castaneum]|uniref:Uncharacterized protein n=1 Tax=Tribolium castaneum TaxID=7070 RepID=D6WGP9_TRICA|nr:PREDICTED: uncharacterized protein LOC103313145 [Tribolium castaneum]EEZ99612.1 hypothetical protein TcasGA2_TC002129 [Tribolium castaneum]|eukprot:XP_008193864.1 PREDICTED: uncharacterized protein LOC103313145 [Tribolium castaneum]
MSDSLPIPDFETTPSDCNSPQIQELNNLRHLLKLQRDRYTHLQILYQAVPDFISTAGALNPDLATKVENILHEQSCQQVEVLDNENTQLLGLQSSGHSELSFNEGLTLRKAIGLILEHKYKKVCDEFLKATSQNVNSVDGRDGCDFSVRPEDNTLVVLKKKLEEQQQKYLENVLTEEKVLEDIAKLRLENYQKCVMKNKRMSNGGPSGRTKTKLARETSRIDVFMERSNSLKAYKELLKDIKEQQLECESEIKHLQEMREKYKQVACKQFDQILKSYVEYKASLSRKEMMYKAYCK